ncbi:recombinase family protein [Nocardia terpenica]|nr:recombinase family protein [Nocardia terpenica]MBF6115220.1 recombinase family protein [Nocardia terpenica]MBF6122542.1 recombinase family protein [Nocardia terpenica]
MTAIRRRGRPRQCPDAVLDRIIDMHRSGIGYRGICRVLNAEAIPTPAGRPTWHPSHVSRLLNTRNVVERFGRPQRRRRRSRPVSPGGVDVVEDGAAGGFVGVEEVAERGDGAHVGGGEVPDWVGCGAGEHPVEQEAGDGAVVVAPVEFVDVGEYQCPPVRVGVVGVPQAVVAALGDAPLDQGGRVDGYPVGNVGGGLAEFVAGQVLPRGEGHLGQVEVGVQQPQLLAEADVAVGGEQVLEFVRERGDREAVFGVGPVERAPQSGWWGQQGLQVVESRDG